MTNPADHTTSGAPTGADATAADPQISGGPADRLDTAGKGSGGIRGAGADGETAAREELRKDLGERPEGADVESGDDLEQAAALGATDDPEGGSIQAHGSNPT